MLVDEKIPDDIKELESKISHLRNQEAQKYFPSRELEHAGMLAFGIRIAVELLSAIIVGGAIGFVIDRAASTSPIFLVMFLLFGGAAGFLNVYRLSKAQEEKNDGESK